VPISSSLRVRHLGCTDYQQTWQQMVRFTAARSEQTVDELWCCEHAPVFTLGQAGKPEHLLADLGIPLLKTDRGGQITYHGPGQVCVYPIIDLGITFYQSLHYDDMMYVHTRPVNLERVRLQFDYIVTHAEKGYIVCAGYTKHCAANTAGTPVAVDPKTVQYLAGHESSKITMDIYAKVKYNRPDELVRSMSCAFASWDAAQ